ncbi:hypothetical protein GGR54DRAFT_648698 [Hypoxylon sp. NC1633]|nr:hypothetical protein GGR54DRAFT_648698 [Hypoxylon sp. NC1633]
MEALAAFGLAANIAQFVAIAGKTVQKTLELSRSTKNTLLKENDDLERIVEDFLGAVPSVESINTANLGSDLKRLAEGAKLVALEIQTKFNDIKARRASRRRHEQLYATLKELRMKDEFDALNDRLGAFRSEITMHINLILLKQQIEIRDKLNGHTESNHAYKDRIESQLIGLIEEVRFHVFTTGGAEVWKGDSDQLEKLVNGIRSWNPQIENFQKTEKLVNSLQFSQIEERHNAIPEAHKNTYRWVLDSDVANLKTWLSTDDAPVYWITGNAGSGKSTLMKYIHDHPRLRARLGDWAKDRKLYVTSHFFWNGGTLLQQSQEGLLRTLLFQVLLERPELTSRVFPARWNKSVGRSEPSAVTSWTTKELLAGLFSLPSALGPDRLFILIDGLDEYNGEHDALINIIESLGKASCIKLCVSSRPWLDFLDAFQDMPWKLQLQDLTKSDIETYVQDHLECHPEFKRLSTRNETAAKELVLKITTRAQGVFLWVYLVVKSMIRGLVNADSMGDLHRRLDDLPQKLEGFFDKILSSIDVFYKIRTAKVFLVLAHARTSMTLISFYFLDEDEGLPFDPDSFLQDWPAVNERDLELVVTKKRQLIAQCKDLIQIIEQPKDPIMFNFTASFLHRTVIDFINQPRIKEKLQQDAGPEFIPLTTLFDINCRQFRTLIHLLPRTYLKPYLRDWYLASIYYAREIEVSLQISKTQQLDQMTNSLIAYLNDRSMVAHSFSQAFDLLLWDHSDRLPASYSASFLNLVANCGLRLYVSDKPQGHTAESKRIMLKSLTPSVHIEQASGFLISLIPAGSPRPAIPLSAEPAYSTTFRMFTTAEEEILQQVKKEVRPPAVQIPTPHSQSPALMFTGPQTLVKTGKLKRFWSKLSR